MTRSLNRFGTPLDRSPWLLCQPGIASPRSCNDKGPAPVVVQDLTALSSVSLQLVVDHI